MRMRIFLAAMCVAASASFATHASDETFGPRASVKRFTATAEVQRSDITHQAGPRGTIAVSGRVDPIAEVADVDSGSCHWGRRTGPRASLC